MRVQSVATQTDSGGVSVRLAEPDPEVASLGRVGPALQITGAAQGPFEPFIMVHSLDPGALEGIDPTTVRVFRLEERTPAFVAHWNSGLHAQLGFVWAKVRRPGIYAAIGLPRDRMLAEVLRRLAQLRRYVDPESDEELQQLTSEILRPVIEAPPEDVEATRRALATIELHSSTRPLLEHPVRVGRGGHFESFPLPGGVGWTELRRTLDGLRIPANGLPEEQLFSPPESLSGSFEPPWPRLPESGLEMPRLTWPWPSPRPDTRPWPAPSPPPRPWCWLISRDWPMYQHDVAHSGRASAFSGLTSTTVGGLSLRRVVPLDGTALTEPAIAGGKAYVGTAAVPGGIGRLYKIDIATGNIEAHFDTPIFRHPTYEPGIGGTPTIAGGRVYVTSISGYVHCLDAATLSPIWTLDLRTPSQAMNHPVSNPNADTWTSPLVVGGRVYIGCGEGEFHAFGFIYCLDAATGRLEWLFSTNKYGDTDNAPNAIPDPAAMSNPLPAWATAAGFSIAPQVPEMSRGCAVWSSPAYDATQGRIFVGTGNSTQGDDQPPPDAPYGSGVLALDAETGAFRGFFQPDAAKSYRPDDTDTDLSSSPAVYSADDRRLVAIGSKSGAFFLLDAKTMNLVAFRQLLPYASGNPVPAVDPHTGPGENMFGVFGTPAVDRHFGRIFVGLGGYGASVDTNSTPFVRALDWTSLDDAWTTAVGPDGVTRYTVPKPPLYTTPGECGLSSPAVVNDVVFVGTTKPGLYALDAATGLSLWSASGLSGNYVLGVAVFGNTVVTAAGSGLYIYST